MNNVHLKNIKDIRLALQEYIPTTSASTKIFFKTGKGQYSEHDRFIGIAVPNLRKLAKTFSQISLETIQELLCSAFNEERLLALLILIDQYTKADTVLKHRLYRFYLENLRYVNNWNLVDASAAKIIGAYLWNKDYSLLLTLSQSTVLWERRISIVATYYFIKNNNVELTFKIARKLLTDKHDLIHKAVGWMLREAGKRDEKALIDFLNQNAINMPRTMLRYALEKFSENQRQAYLCKK